MKEDKGKKKEEKIKRKIEIINNKQ